MPPLTYEENLVATFVAASGISNISAPTATEIAAGDDLSSYIRKNGIQFPTTRNMVDTSSIDRKFNSEYPGSEGGTLTVTGKRKNRDNLTSFEDTFSGGEVEGYWVFGYEGSNATAADVVDVYHVVGHTPLQNNPGPDEEQTVQVSFGVQDWAQGVAVVA